MRRQREEDYVLKLLLIGSTNVGKSGILSRFCENTYHDMFLPTIGVDFKIKRLETGGRDVKPQLWDTAGIQRFKQVTSQYYDCTHGVILVYDISDRISFDEIPNWMVQVNKYANKNTVIILVGNKSDLKERRQVRTEEGKELADSLGIKFLEASAKEDDNIHKIFTTLTNDIISKIEGRRAQTKEESIDLRNSVKNIQGNSLKTETIQQKNSVDAVMKERARRAMADRVKDKQQQFLDKYSYRKVLGILVLLILGCLMLYWSSYELVEKQEI